MKFLTFITLTILAFTTTLASPVRGIQKSIKQSSLITEEELDNIRRKLAVQGCNANVCFAIDGSRSITAEAFEAEKNFVLNVISLITVDEAAELAAVQYGLASSAISPLTSNVGQLISAINDELQLKSRQTFLVAGINYCFGELIQRPGEANKIVVLGDGQSAIGDSAVDRANEFRTFTGGSVCAVSAGFRADTDELLAIAGGNPDQLFTADSFLDTIKLRTILRALVEQICGADLS